MYVCATYRGYIRNHGKEGGNYYSGLGLRARHLGLIRSGSPASWPSSIGMTRPSPRTREIGVRLCSQKRSPRFEQIFGRLQTGFRRESHVGRFRSFPSVRRSPTPRRNDSSMRPLEPAQADTSPNHEPIPSENSTYCFVPAVFLSTKTVGVLGGMPTPSIPAAGTT